MTTVAGSDVVWPLCHVHRFLLGWLFSDRHADDSPGRQNAFALLRAVLGRKIVVPEVYDVMEWVQEVMVK
jgi:U3 small nucleolar RNA-associated protein 20